MAYKQKSPIPVPEGGTGLSSNTAYAPIVGGTTSTSALQNATTGLGTSAFVLTSTGSSSLPTMQVATGNCMVATTLPLNIICSTIATRFGDIGGVPGAGELGSVIAYNCIAKNLYVRVTANASTTDCAITLRQSAVSTALTLTIPALTTGIFSNTSNLVSLTGGNKIDWMTQKATTGNVTGVISMVLSG